ncbi:MAG: polymer-forming cytoskeletal protein [Syntrophomonadaceae bacterium]|jgi:cytoskeletal protein CcmA (bactofilin family)
MKPKGIIAILVLFILVLAGYPVGASEDAYSGDRVIIVPEETLTGATFISGREVIVKGNVDGDLYATGRDIIVEGRVMGDVLAAGQNILINGPVYGDVRLAGQRVTIEQEVKGSAAVACRELVIAEHAQIIRDLSVVVGDAQIYGTIGRKLNGAAQLITIHDRVGQHVRLYNVNQLNLKDGAHIGGDLKYSSSNRANISPQATITGQELWTKIEATAQTEEVEGIGIFFFLLSLGSLLLVWGAVKLWNNQAWTQMARPIKEKFSTSLGLGVLLLLATPVLVIIFLLTIIGIPFALLLLIVYILLLSISKIIVGEALGEFMAERSNRRIRGFWAFLLALLVIMLAVKAPYVGWLISLGVMATALGAVFKAVRPAD